MLAFAWGIWKIAGENRRLRIAGVLMLAYGALGFLGRSLLCTSVRYWQRVEERFLILCHCSWRGDRDLLSAWIGVCGTALGKRFRIYSTLTFIVLLVFGILTFLDAPGVSTNQPTPLIGVWERINIGAFLLWVVVLAITLLRTERLPDSIKERHFNVKQIQAMSSDLSK